MAEDHKAATDFTQIEKSSAAVEKQILTDVEAIRVRVIQPLPALPAFIVVSTMFSYYGYR